MEKRLRFTAEFKCEAVQFAMAEDKPVVSMAQQFGVPRNKPYKATPHLRTSRQNISVMQLMRSTWARHIGQCLSVNAVRQLNGGAIEQTFPDPCVRMSVLA
jgi:hypothetical protein